MENEMSIIIQVGDLSIFLLKNSLVHTQKRCKGRTEGYTVSHINKMG